MKKIMIITFFILLAGFIGFGVLYFKERTNRIRLQGNQQTLTTQTESRILADSSQAVESGILNLTKKEFRQANDSLFLYIKERMNILDLKLRQIESISGARIINTKEIITNRVRDTLINTVPGKIWDWKDKFYTVSCLELENDRMLNITYRDRMTQTIFRERKGWKFWKRAQLKQVINFENPDTKIEYPVYIQIKK